MPYTLNPESPPFSIDPSIGADGTQVTILTSKRTATVYFSVISVCH